MKVYGNCITTSVFFDLFLSSLQIANLFDVNVPVSKKLVDFKDSLCNLFDDFVLLYNYIHSRLMRVEDTA